LREERYVKSVIKWFSGLFVLTLVLLSFSTFQADAASTSNLPIFYKDAANSKVISEDAFLYTGSSGTVYQMIYEENKINAISATGKKIWSYTFPSYSSLILDGIAQTMVEEKGNFYIGYSDNGMGKNPGNYLVSFNSKGKINWKFKLLEKWDTGPGKLLFDKEGTVYFGTGNYTGRVGPYSESRFYADTSKGKMKWSIKLDGDGFYSTPYFDSNGNIVIVTENDENPIQYTISKKGKILAKKNTNTFRYYTDKAYNVYFIDYVNNKLIAANKSGKKLWSYGVNKDTTIGYVADNDTVYISKDGYILAISNGKVKWKAKAAGNIYYNKAGLYVIDFDWDWEKDTGNMMIKVLDELTGKVKYSKTLNSVYYRYTVHPKGFVLVPKGVNIYKVSLFPEQSPALKPSQIKIVNNKGKADTITVSGLTKGDKIQVYNTSSKGKLLASKTSTGSTVTLSIKQPGTKSGKIYITLTRKGMTESNRIAVSYATVSYATEKK
jgi:hypothetical protein